jgi:hypothetical protein
MNINEKTTTLSIGSVALIEKVDTEFSYLGSVLRSLDDKSEEFVAE